MRFAKFWMKYCAGGVILPQCKPLATSIRSVVSVTKLKSPVRMILCLLSLVSMRLRSSVSSTMVSAVLSDGLT